MTQPILSKTEFGLWFIHKAAYAFFKFRTSTNHYQIIYQVDELIQKIGQCESQAQAIEMIQSIRYLKKSSNFYIWSIKFFRCLNILVRAMMQTATAQPPLFKYHRIT